MANLKVAKARQQEAVLQFEQSLLDAGNEVNNALTGWQTAYRRIRFDKEQIADLEAATEKQNCLYVILHLLILKCLPLNSRCLMPV